MDEHTRINAKFVDAFSKNNKLWSALRIESLQAWIRSCQVFFVVLTDSVGPSRLYPAASNSSALSGSRSAPADQQQLGSHSKGLYLGSSSQACRLTFPPQTNQMRSKTNQRRSIQ